MNLRKHKKLLRKHNDTNVYYIEVGQMYADWTVTNLTTIKTILPELNYMKPVQENIELNDNVNVIILDIFNSNHNNTEFAVCKIVSDLHKDRIGIFKKRDLVYIITNY